jgi:hypothetical protein
MTRVIANIVDHYAGRQVLTSDLLIPLDANIIRIDSKGLNIEGENGGVRFNWPAELDFCGYLEIFLKSSP